MKLTLTRVLWVVALTTLIGGQSWNWQLFTLVILFAPYREWIFQIKTDREAARIVKAQKKFNELFEDDENPTT